MKTKKMLASVLATVSAISCMATITASAWTLHNKGSVRYNGSTSFTDTDNSNSNRASYKAKVSQWCYYYIDASLTSKHNGYSTDCYISGEKKSGGWEYFADGYGYCDAEVKMTNAWQYNPLYSKFDYENSYLCSRLNIYK